MAFGGMASPCGAQDAQNWSHTNGNFIALINIKTKTRLSE